MSRKQKQQLVTQAPASLKLAIGFGVIAVVAYVIVLLNGGIAMWAHGLPPRRTGAVTSVTVLGGRIRFHDVARQSREFIGYASSIRLDPRQQAVKTAALQSRPAACCSKSDALTCCCDCNLSKTVWGLTSYAIANYNADENQVHEVVDGWLSFVNASGYDGKACYRGGCQLPLHEKGCGGMSEGELSP